MKFYFYIRILLKMNKKRLYDLLDEGGRIKKYAFSINSYFIAVWSLLQIRKQRYKLNTIKIFLQPSYFKSKRNEVAFTFHTLYILRHTTV